MTYYYLVRKAGLLEECSNRIASALAFYLKVIAILLLAGPTDAAATVSEKDEPAEAQRLVLAIGISEFDDPFWSDLKFAGKDATDMHRFFTQQATPSFDWAALLTSDQSDSQRPVTKQYLEDTLLHLQQANRSEQDIIILYISTHGTVELDDDGKPSRYLVMQDTRASNIRSTAIRFDDLMSAFRSLKSRKKALILDSCYSGVGKSVITNAMIEEIGKRKGTLFPDIFDEVARGEYILAASRWDQTAQESDTLQNGIYTHYLLEGFGQDQNHDGAVSLREAHSYARTKTYLETGGQQTPNERSFVEDTDPIYITGQKRSGFDGSYLYNYLEKLAKLDVYINGVYRGKLKGGVAVPSGAVRVKLVDPKLELAALDRVYKIEPRSEESFSNLLQERQLYHLELGYKLGDYLSRQYTDYYASSATLAPELRFVWDDAIWIYNLHGSIARHTLDGSQETVKTRSGILTRTDRREWELYLGLGQRHQYHVWPFSARKLKTFGFCHAGVLGQRIEIHRQVSQESFDAHTGGLRLNCGLEAQVPLLNLKVGSEAQLSLLASPFRNTESLVLKQAIVGYIGANW